MKCFLGKKVVKIEGYTEGGIKSLFFFKYI